MFHKREQYMWPGHGLDKSGVLLRPAWNYSLPDGSAIYTHRNGRVFMYDEAMAENREIGRSVAAMLLYGARHGEQAPFSHSGVLRYR